MFRDEGAAFLARRESRSFAALRMTEPQRNAAEEKRGERDIGAGSGPGGRAEIEQLLRADDRRLVRHARHLDDRVLVIEVVAVVVGPSPEIDESGDAERGESREPADDELSTAGDRRDD